MNAAHVADDGAWQCGHEARRRVATGGRRLASLWRAVRPTVPIRKSAHVDSEGEYLRLLAAVRAAPGQLRALCEDDVAHLNERALALQDFVAVRREFGEVRDAVIDDHPPRPAKHVHKCPGSVGRQEGPDDVRVKAQAADGARDEG